MPTHELKSALTEQQEAVIRDVLDALIDLPSDETSLRGEIASLTLALDEPLLDPNHPFAQLQKCYQDPTACFYRLEEMNQNITVGMVQKFILTYLGEMLAKAAPPNTNLEAWGWDPARHLEKLYQFQPNSLGTFSTPFISQSSDFDVDDPWQIPERSELIYRITLQSTEDRRLQVKIHIDLPDCPLLDDDWIDYPTQVETDEEEDAFIYAKHLEIQEEAEIRVGEQLVRYLRIKKKITLEERRQAGFETKQLLTYRYYFAALLEGKMKLSELLSLSPDQAHTLAQPAMIALHRAGKCELAFAKGLKRCELAVCINPYYSDQILHDQMLADDLKGLSPEQSTLLNLPTVIHLQRKGKISYFQAKAIAKSALPIFKSERCIEMILSDQLPFEEVSTFEARRAELLGNDYYASEVLNDHLSLSEIHELSDEEIDNLLLPCFIELQKKGRLSLQASKNAPAHICELLQDDVYFDLALQGKLPYSFIQPLTPQQCATLLDPPIRSLILNGKLKAERAVLLSQNQKGLLSKPAFFKLFYAGKLSLADLDEIPCALAKVFEKNVSFQGLLMQDIFTIEDFLNCLVGEEPADQPLIEIGLQFCGRLVGLLKDKPYLFRSGVPDNIVLLQEDLEELIPPRFLQFRAEICDHTLKFFLRYLRSDLALQQKEQREEAHSLYAAFLRKFQEASQTLYAEENLSSNTDYLACFHSLEKMATDIRENYSQTSLERQVTAIPLFTPGKLIREYQKIQTFYGTISLARNLAIAFERGRLHDHGLTALYLSNPTRKLSLGSS